jgi:hypothetical protein
MGRCIIDKKSGKVAPWTALQLAAYELLDTPVDFRSEGHIYTHQGAVLPSVTQILKAEGFIDTTFFDDWSRDRGSMVHLATAYDDAGELDEDSLDPVIVPYLEAWRRFRLESGFVTEASEVSMMSSVHRFAGTIDTIGHFPTGNLARAAVELHDDGTYKLIPFTDRTDRGVFLAALACHNWKQNNLRGRKP